MSDWKNSEDLDSVAEAVNQCLPGIIIAGALYAVACASLMFIWEHGSQQSPFGTIAVLGLFTGCGTVMAAFTGAFSVVVINLMNHFLSGVFSRRAAVAITGGLAGFLPSFFPLLFVYHQPRFVELDEVLWTLSFPFFAVMFGQIGAVWMASKEDIWKNYKQELDYRAKHPQPGFQFQTAHLLKIMILISAVFAINQLTPHHEFLLVLGCYFVFQSFWLLVDRVHFRRWQRKLMATDNQAHV